MNLRFADDFCIVFDALKKTGINKLQMVSVKTKKATKMVAYKQLQKRFASIVRRSIFRCRTPGIFSGAFLLLLSALRR